MQIPKWMRVFLGWILIGIGLPPLYHPDPGWVFTGNSWWHAVVLCLPCPAKPLVAKRRATSHPSLSKVSLSALTIHEKRNYLTKTKSAIDKFWKKRDLRTRYRHQRGL
jgi:hypothetical protein